MTNKSPFLIIQEFLSPLKCEKIINELDFSYPDVDINNKQLITVIKHNRLQKPIKENFKQLIPNIENHFNVKVNNLTEMEFTLIPNNTEILIKKNDEDFTCLIFLKDYCVSNNFDISYEVYGGKINFLSWGFGINPERGTIIIFPSTSNFMYKISEVCIGKLIFIKFNIKTNNKFIFNKNYFKI